MAHISYSDLFKAPPPSVHQGPIMAGDLVRTGANLFPHYTVIAVDDDRVWLRDASTGVDSLGDLNRCRRINGPSDFSALD